MGNMKWLWFVTVVIALTNASNSIHPRFIQKENDERPDSECTANPIICKWRRDMDEVKIKRILTLFCKVYPESCDEKKVDDQTNKNIKKHALPPIRCIANIQLCFNSLK